VQQQEQQLIESPVVCAGHLGVHRQEIQRREIKFRWPGSMMDHHGPTVRLPTKIPRLLLVHLFVAALLTVESSSSSLSSALLLIPADSQRPAPISSRPPSPDEAAANSIDTSDDECESFSRLSVRLFHSFCYTLGGCPAAAAAAE
jgi:hypothetical protein